MPDIRRERGPHVFVDDLDVPHLTEADHHHLSRSLRLREGDPLTISDGRGRWRTASFGAAPDPTGPIIVAAAPPWGLRLACALAKASKPELVVQKATELGVDEVVFFAARRSVARWDDAKATKAVDRLTRVAREASMQSRRVDVPTIAFVADTASLAVQGSWSRADFGGEPLGAEHRMIAIGPEGGWDDTEREMLPSVVDLGPSVLRAETAAIAATTLMAQCRHATRDS